MSLFPIFLKLEGRRCLVVGAGEIAEGKIQSLLAADAHVTVVAPEATLGLTAIARPGRIEWNQREFVPGDLDGVFLVVAATNVPEVNATVYREALQRNVICNAVDDPPNCDFYFPSIVKRGDLQIAISTAGESPALAQQLRKEIDEQLPDNLSPWLAALGELRREVLAAMPAGDNRKLLLHDLAQRSVCELNECPSRQLARNRSHVSQSRPGSPDIRG
ncbi:bifunctional precorrin-2 dehydrogenase/sirohydrochlorin ferrochelatase [Alloacidobacterium sp.]|uniref:precorrin-2 dehydrogenase/sirohydrochlorin ferrochelatase family protein n=1 Tax=Alloacidobacterium sp. TaxID=2951999 RepID=UPI002D2D1735|nr:bifunctional precorrin-2 dehydrogenase/sirohydrochlorin ferrochelatase [Alloacidobacterium sp.]HYK37078.1 bifunctional precorrin-2 dehydrogenase/sirohydrochlorin ferrochelatase [Alloacidobacterium sp.]